MELWLEVCYVILVTISGILLGKVFSRLQKPYWFIGYVISFSLIAILVITRYIGILSFLAPFSWLATGPLRFIVLALAITIGLTTVLPHLPRKFEKVIACILMVLFVAHSSVSPLVAPALLKDDLSNLKTIIDPSGVCLQSRTYTCGPAAAVTALRKLGFDAQEGEMAVLARSNPITGTFPGYLYTAIQNRYGNKGLKCRYQHFDSINQLKNRGITLAVIKEAFLSDHCVAVLEVSDRRVVIADPGFGKLNMSHEQFEKIWRFSGIVLNRPASPERQRGEDLPQSI
jgi:predicted double-glycine peptidase